MLRDYCCAHVPISRLTWRERATSFVLGPQPVLLDFSREA